MTTKYAVVCFTILSITLLLGGLVAEGGFVLLRFYYPDPSTMRTACILAINGFLCWGLGILSALSAWRFLKRAPKAGRLARVTWLLVSGFTLWILLFDGLQGWSKGGVAEVIIWGVLEVLIGIYLIRARRGGVT